MTPAFLLAAAGVWCVTGAGTAEPCAVRAAVSHADAGAASQQGSVNRYAEAMAAFLARVDRYLEMRRAVATDMPEVKETGDPAQISLRQQQLGLALAKARAGAKPGDLFGPELTPYLVAIVADDLSGRSVADRQALNAEVPATVRLRVNQLYPTTLPLLSVPANLLAKMPTLPEALEYRLVHRRLLLRDRDANLIIDILTPAASARQVRPR